MYSCGNIRIPKDELHDFLRNVGSGQYDTFQLLERFQGFQAINKGIPVGRAWNAQFGKILAKCANQNPNLLVEINKSVTKVINNRRTMNSVWEIK